jgi:hypothetical protein
MERPYTVVVQQKKEGVRRQGPGDARPSEGLAGSRVGWRTSSWARLALIQHLFQNVLYFFSFAFQQTKPCLLPA